MSDPRPDAAPRTPRVVVHVLSGCGHCHRAISLLDRRAIDYEVRSGDGVPGFRASLRERYGGSTVPQIVIGNRPIGGASDLARLDRRGVLNALMSGEEFPAIRAHRRRFRPRASRWVADLVEVDGRRLARATGRDEAAAREQLAAHRT